MINKKQLKEFALILALALLVLIIVVSSINMFRIATVGKASETLFGENQKLMSKYSDKEVFLVSDEDWKEVLPLIPLAVWTNSDNNISKYPLLVYHKEENSFDIDSIFHFLEQYNVRKITYFGEMPSELYSLLESSFSIEQKQNILEYWESYEDVIYVENDYELGLMSSTYASLINAPLIIEGYNDNIDLSNKNVVCIGNPTVNCNEKYNLEELQTEYLTKTDTDKIILVNPDDINNFIGESFVPEKSTTTISKIYSKTSLSAPILASAKHELIISTTSTNYDSVDFFIKNEINNFGVGPKYLTIIANPDSISDRMPHFGNPSLKDEVDNYIYGDLDNDNLQDLAVGRIYGITSSDVSAYVSRVLFYNQLPQSNNFNTLNNIMDPWVLLKAKRTDLLLSSYGMNQQSIYFKPVGEYTSFDAERDIKNKKIIAYFDHGGPTGWSGLGSEDLHGTFFDPSFIFSNACSTCDYSYEGGRTRLFCINLIRKGAIGVIAAITGASNQDGSFMMHQMLNGKSIGEAWKIENIASELKRKIDFSNSEESTYGRQFILIGDPTFNFNFDPPQELPKETRLEFEELRENKIRVKINVPELKKNFTYNSTYSHQRIDVMFEPTLTPHLFKGIGDEIAFVSLNKSIYPLLDQFILYQEFFFEYDIPESKIISNIKVQYDVQNNVNIDTIFNLPFNFSDNLYVTDNEGRGEIIYQKDPETNKYYFLFAHKNVLCADGGTAPKCCECNTGNPSSEDTFDTLPEHSYYIDIELSDLYICNNNSICDPGENAQNCPEDCFLQVPQNKNCLCIYNTNSDISREICEYYNKTRYDYSLEHYSQPQEIKLLGLDVPFVLFTDNTGLPEGITRYETIVEEDFNTAVLQPLLQEIADHPGWDITHVAVAKDLPIRVRLIEPSDIRSASQYLTAEQNINYQNPFLEKLSTLIKIIMKE